MKLFNTLYSKLSASLLTLLLVLGVVLMFVAQRASDMYSQEVTQRLNSSIAMYVTAEQQLIRNGTVNQAALDKLASRAMTINPTVEIYLLDKQGRILTHLLPEDDIQRRYVSLQPIRSFLDESEPFPIVGDDPRGANSHKVFSVSPVQDNGQTVGYLYAILGGQKYQSLKETVQASYILKLSTVTIMGSLIMAAVAAVVIFFFLTRRLGRLRREVEAFHVQKPDAGITIEIPPKPRDEIDQLGASFIEMAQHISQQFKALQNLDTTRRELIANVSHDLRTPLASMQGYIETLLIKYNELSEDKKKEYLTIAHKHSQRLNALIAELFELAKLDSGATELNTESFSLLELVHDCAQELQLNLIKKQVKLDILAENGGYYVFADIALIQRVLHNLLDNALCHTPAGGSISIRIRALDNKTVIEVVDTGKGIAAHEIPHIFERFYQSQKNRPANDIGSGLGLAIVKRILELHKSQISVQSELNRGSTFSFSLPAAVIA